MARENLYWDLVHAAEVADDEAQRSLLYDAAFEVSRLSDENEELKEGRNRLTVSVEFSQERFRSMLDEAFVNVTGKGMDYVCLAVREKMEREGECVVTE